MALTPLLGTLGEKFAKENRKQRGFLMYEGKDNEASQLVEQVQKSSKGYVVVCGYGNIGRTICRLLDAEGEYEYIAFENNPTKAIQARSTGLSVFLADCTRREVLESFKVSEARLVVVAMGKKEEANHVCEAISRQCPNVPILVRARDDSHQAYLTRTFGLDAVIPTLPPDSVLLSLPFGGEVLRRLGYPDAEIETLAEEIRRQAYSEGDLKDEPLTEKALKDIFKRFDTDGSGYIDASEMKEMLSNLGRDFSDGDIAELMDQATEGGRSEISLGQFKTMVKNKLFDK